MLSAPNFKKTLIVAIKQGGIAEAAIGGVIETNDCIINRTLFLLLSGIRGSANRRLAGKSRV